MSITDKLKAVRLPLIPADKAQHVSYGAALGMAGALIGESMVYCGDFPIITPLVCTLTAGAVFGVFKDYVLDDVADVWDVAATIYGSAFVAVPLGGLLLIL